MRQRAWVLFAYFLSGACGLVYEVVWTRLLSLTFGVTVFATSTVLASFMAGLGLGSFLVGRWIDRRPDPLRVYAVLELAIGLYALAVPLLFELLEPAYIALANALESSFLLFNLARATLAFAVLIVPTTLMGGTVPAMSRYLITRSDSVGWSVGLLYALNTFGAVVGCLGAGFVLMGALGMSRTILVTALVNLAIGVAILVARRGHRPAEREAIAPDVPPDAAHEIADGASVGGTLPSSIRLATLVFALSGFTALAAEVVWTRALVVYVHNSTYAFSLMLGIFLIGLAVGDALLMRFYDRIARPLFWLGTVEVAIGISVMVAALMYLPLRHIGSLSRESWLSALALMSARAGLVLLPGALLFGMTFPLVARIVLLELGRIGRDLGRVYAANTLGGVLGSIAGGFLLVPALGMRGTLLVLAATNAILGGLCWMASSSGTRRLTLGAVALGIAVLPAVVIPPTIFFDALEMGDFKLVYYREGATDTTGVWESKSDGQRVVTYGDMRGTAGTSTDVPNRIQGHLAHLLHPNPRKSLQICFGVGNTLAAAALHPEVEQLDCVELSPHVRETAPFFWTNDDVLANPKVKLIVDDGRNYLLRTPERYDVITLEPPDIYNAGVVNLYTEEFYRLAAGALSDDGIFCQWLPTAEMNEAEMRMLVRSFANVFPETTLWLGAKTVMAPPLLLVGSKKPIAIDPEALGARMQNEAVRGDLQRLGIGDPEKLLDFYIAGSQGTRAWLGDAPPVTDDRTVVDFSTPRSVYSGFGLGYFVVAGKELEEHQAHRRGIADLYRRLREPAAALLVAGVGGDAK